MLLVEVKEVKMSRWKKMKTIQQPTRLMVQHVKISGKVLNGYGENQI